MDRRGMVAAMATAGLVALAVGATAAPGVAFGTGRARMPDSEDVTVRLINTTNHRIELFGGAIRDADGDLEVRLKPERRFLPPDAEHAWTWVHQGDAGRFVARFRTSAGRVKDRFELGAYFTIAFRCNEAPEECPEPFVIWVWEEAPIKQLRNDLEQPESQRRIVSGIVRGAKPYNRDWSYTMGPGSIVLGEVFTEVCDAHPDYVENHRRRWMGERWCPWSSFVASEGK